VLTALPASPPPRMSSSSGSSGSSTPRRTGWLTHQYYYWHDSGTTSHERSVQPLPSGESAETKRRFANLVEVSLLSSLLQPLRPRPATDAEILRVHTARHLAHLKEVSAEGGPVGHELHMGRGGFDIAALSAGGVLQAMESVLRGDVHNAYALVRPPGHHAEADAGHGFCALDNVAIAAEAALAVHGLKKVAILDIDVHHGNGVEQAFFAREDVLYISLHQDGLYPLDTGGVEVVGEGRGRGYNLNIPLPPGSGIGAYRAAFSQVVEPALAAFQPELILVSCGFDASFLDPLGRMLLTSADFGELTQRIRLAAEQFCGGKLVFAHEGGYSEVSGRAQQRRRAHRMPWSSCLVPLCSQTQLTQQLFSPPPPSLFLSSTCPSVAWQCWRSCVAPVQASQTPSSRMWAAPSGPTTAGPTSRRPSPGQQRT
jgi:acetoin utilization deacetylase AcuC-like enzyme